MRADYTGGRRPLIGETLTTLRAVSLCAVGGDPWICRSGQLTAATDTLAADRLDTGSVEPTT